MVKIVTLWKMNKDKEMQKKKKHVK